MPLLLFYLFAILACASRVGRYGAMIYWFSANQPTFSLLSIVIDIFIQCCIASAGLCLITSMFELYTNVNLILIELECIENRSYRRHERAEVMLRKKQGARHKFVAFKVFIYVGICLLLASAIAQLTVIYMNHHDQSLAEFS